MSLFSGYKKEKSPEAEERLAEAEEIMNESDNCLSEAESVDAEEYNASEEPASEEEAEGFFFENLLEFTVYCKYFGGNRTIYWKEGDGYWKAYKYGYEAVEEGRIPEAFELFNLCLVLNPIGLSARFEVCELYLKLHDLTSARKTLMDMKDYLLEDKKIARFYRRMGYIETEKGNYKVASACYQYSRKFENHPSIDQELAYIRSKSLFGINKGDPVKVLEGARIPVLSSTGIDPSNFGVRR